jgi:hypothetical protein
VGRVLIRRRARAQSGSGVGGREDAHLLGKVAQESAETEPLRRQRRRRVVHVEEQTLHGFQLFPPPTPHNNNTWYFSTQS